MSFLFFKHRLIGLIYIVICTFYNCTPDQSPTPPSLPLPPVSIATDTSTTAQHTVTFTDVTSTAGINFRHQSGNRIKNYIVEAKGGGGAFFDYNNDGYLDVYLVNGSRFSAYPAGSAPTNVLYHNQGNGTFVDYTTQSASGDPRWGMGCVAGDYDNDGDQDLYITNYGPNTLYANQGNGTFIDIGSQAKVALESWSTAAVFGDYDNDGDLDLYVAQYVDFVPQAIPPRAGMWKGVLVFAGPRGLPAAPDVLYRNNGDASFTDITTSAGISASTPWYGLGAVFGDYNNDGLADLYIANDSAPNFLYHNNGDGTFTDVGPRAGVAFGEGGTLQAGMGIAYGDYNNDGQRDYYVTHFEDDYNTLYHNHGNGTFSVTSFTSGLGHPSQPNLGFGACFLDYDNDGDQDLAVANGHVYPQMHHVRPNGTAEPNQLFQNLGPAHNFRYSEITAPAFAQLSTSRGSCLGDYDNDGDQDVLFLNLEASPNLLRNDGGNKHHWLNISLQGTRSNRYGIGAKVHVTAGNIVQIFEITAGGSFMSHNDIRAHFGLGTNKLVDQLDVHWPSGQIQTLTQIAANQFIVLKEP